MLTSECEVNVIFRLISPYKMDKHQAMPLLGKLNADLILIKTIFIVSCSCNVAETSENYTILNT